MVAPTLCKVTHPVHADMCIRGIRRYDDNGAASKWPGAVGMMTMMLPAMMLRYCSVVQSASNLELGCSPERSDASAGAVVDTGLNCA